MAKDASILVTGGAGYIGGQTVLALLDAGYSVVVLDDLSSGRISEFHKQTKFYQGAVQDPALLATVFEENSIAGIMHFAASIEVDASVKDPFAYYDNNLIATQSLLMAARSANIQAFVLSSTAAVYGDIKEPAREDMLVNPINPYGSSKLFAERSLISACAASDMTYGILRYFNVAGADPLGRHGSYSVKAKHLIGRCFDAVHSGQALTIFGNDFETKDGSGVRDYISVADLAEIHVCMINYLLNGGASQTLNLGYGSGYSVFDIVDAVNAVTGKAMNINIGQRREGDPAAVIADTLRLQSVLDWKPQYNDLHDIIETAYEWYRSVSVKSD